MAPKKTSIPKTSTKKVADITEMEDETSPQASPKAAAEAAPAVKVITLETLYHEISDLKTQVAELLLVVGSMNNSLVSPNADLTKVAPKKVKSETTFNWFKTRVQKDDALLEAILRGNNSDLWKFGEYKTKFQGNVSQVSGSETDEVRKKAAHTLWVKCFGKPERDYIKEYRDKVDPPEVATKSKKKKCVLFPEDDAAGAAGAAEPPVKVAVTKPAAKKPAAKGKKTVPPSAPDLTIEDDVKSNNSDSQDDDDDED